MIHKIERITSIGKFRNYQAVGDVAFKKLTLVYADNGSGKTTLAAIFRSLTQNRPDYIRRRISTNFTTPQAAQIIQRDSTGTNTFHTFGANGWTQPFPDIEIFDVHFVNENVYSGFEFNDDHRKQLHQFVIGAQGVAIQQQIEQNKIDKGTSRNIQGSLEQQLIQQVANNLTTNKINEFLNIPITQSINIDQQIITAEIALANANANSVIQNLPTLLQVNNIISRINFESIITDLRTDSTTIQDATLQTLFENHCTELTNHSIEGSEKWLKTGFNYLESKHQELGKSVQLTCPFCKQNISNNLDIIRAYTLHFNEEFNQFVQRIQNQIDTLQNFNLDAVLQEIDITHQNNIERHNSWITYLPNTQVPVFNIVPNVEALKTEFSALKTALQQKLQNPSKVVEIEPVTTFQNSLQLVIDNINIYNQSVMTYNNAITNFRTGIQTVEQAQNELSRLKRIKKRFEPAIEAICTQLITERQNLRNLENAYTQLIEQQQIAAMTFFNSYKDRINHYLGTVFKTNFRIDNVVNIPPQGRATQSKIGYQLTIDGQAISFDPNQPICTKDCLSEGDKSTIALAFFLSKLDIDPGLNNKILIFDDPLSSFDSNRRLYTVQIIKDLLPNLKQIVVLSHNEFFLYELSKDVAASDKKCLRITMNYLTNASIIEPLCLETLVENDYFKHINELENFLQNADISKKDIVLGWMRNVLEAHIRFKFYRQTKHLSPNNRTFGNLITTLVDRGVVFRDNTNRAAIITKLKQINGISCKPHHGEPLPDYATLGANPNTMNVTELANFVKDTLNLIDNQL